jgi:hypothetical protein
MNAHDDIGIVQWWHRLEQPESLLLDLVLVCELVSQDLL